MTWFGWLLSVMVVISSLYSISQVGKRRDVITPAVACCQVIVAGLLLWGYATVGTVS